MVEDPRLRFVFAFTIENTVIRAWTSSRFDVLVSEPFSFIMVYWVGFYHIDVYSF
jgi:hypothetical protein